MPATNRKAEDMGRLKAAARREEGAVTVELALALPSVAALLALLVGLGSAAVGQLRVSDAARAGARVAALGRDDGAVAAVAVAAAGVPVEVSVSRSDGLVAVRCQGSVWVPLFGARGASAEAVAACEPARGCG
jgi:Flp pilus assembly protein TadG